MQHPDWKQEIKRNRLPCMECAWIVHGLCPRCTQGTLMVHTSYKGQCVTIGHCQHPVWKSAMLKIEKRHMKSKLFNFQYIIHTERELPFMHFFYIKICGIPLFLGPLFWSTGCEAVPLLPRPKIEMSMCSPCRDLGFVFSFFRGSWERKNRGIRWFMEPFFVSFRFQLRFEVFVLRNPWLPWFLKGMGLDARTTRTDRFRILFKFFECL